MRTASPTTNGARLRVAVNVDVDPRDHDELLRKAESYATWGVDGFSPDGGQGALDGPRPRDGLGPGAGGGAAQAGRGPVLTEAFTLSRVLTARRPATAGADSRSVP